MNKGIQFAVFDLDGTITKKDTYIPFLINCVLNGCIPNLSILIIPYYIIAFKLKFVSNHKLKEIFLKAFLGGVQINKLKFITKRFVDNLMAKGIREEIINIIDQYYQSGGNLMIASASFDFYVDEIAKKLKIDNVICTRAEVRKMRITGRLNGKNCYGKEKARRVLEFINQHQKSSIAVYTDHYSDHPLIKEASAVYIIKPSKKTRRILERHGYQIEPIVGMKTLNRLIMC